jgi:hypothetical protein
VKAITLQELSFQYNNPDWAISIHDFNGKFIQASMSKKNLLDVITHCKNKYVCDSNSSWKEQAADKTNRAKIFLLSNPTMDEQKDFYNNLFATDLHLTNRNIYITSILPEAAGVAIEHFTEELWKARDKNNLRKLSQDRVKGIDAEFVESEKDFMTGVQIDKQNILTILNGFDLNNITSDSSGREEANNLKSSIVKKIHAAGSKCYRNYFLCNEVVYLCYATLLLEIDSVGIKTRKEFFEQKRNVFGDITIVRDALWLNAKILSNDNAIKRMVSYLNLPKIKVVGLA